MVRVAGPADLDGPAVLAVAAGARVELDPDLLAAVARRRDEVLAALADDVDVYGVTTGMGALSDTRLTPAEQADHSRRLMLARAVGGPPYLDAAETRALLAVRLRTFLEGDAGVSAELCSWLTTLLAHDLLPPVPRTGSGAAGEILPLAHAWGHLAGLGPLALGDLAPPVLGPKEGIALLAGVPVATGLALLRAADLHRFVRRAGVVAAGSVVVARAQRDPYDDAVARGDAELAVVLADLRALVGPEPAPRHLQAPVSFRVVGPVLAHLQREADRLAATAERALGTVGDSPAYLATQTGSRFVGTPGFHGLDLAAALDGARAAVVHAAAVSAARLHRLLDPGVTGLPAQLSADPGPFAGLAPLHKRAAATLHEVAGWPASTAFPVETSLGQEDVQTFALEAADRLLRALEAAETVLLCELLAVHQARTLDPGRVPPGPLVDLLDEVAAVLPPGADDRPFGEDVERLRGLLSAGWAPVPSSP